MQGTFSSRAYTEDTSLLRVTKHSHRWAFAFESRAL